MKLGKCKQALADLINANGGWVDGEAIFAAMDGNGDLFGYSGRPQWTVSHGHWYGHTLTCWFFSPVVMKNHHQTILSREEYYQAYPKADADGWVEWGGGERPVSSVVMVDTKHRCGRIDTNRRAGSAWWHHAGSAGDIVSYRLHKPEVKPELCESVMRSIPEPEFDDAGSRLAKALELVKSAAPHMLRDKYKFDGNEVMGERKPTIEQLAQDYRNAKDYADRKQQEADEAKADVEAKLKELELACEAIGLLVLPIIAKQEHELAAAVKVGDEVECVESNIKRDQYNGMVGRLHTIDESDTSTPYLVDFGGNEKIWCHKVKFISRP